MRGVRAQERLKRTIKRGEKKISQATKRAAQAEVLLPTDAGVLEAEGMERTDRFTQQQIANEVDMQTQRKAYDVTLDKVQSSVTLRSKLSALVATGYVCNITRVTRLPDSRLRVAG